MGHSAPLRTARRPGRPRARAGSRRVPITTSGQSSSPIAVRPSPSRIASRSRRARRSPARSSRSTASTPAGLDRVVDARDDEQDPWAMKPSCMPFSGEISGRTAVIIPIPMNEIEATRAARRARDEVRVAQVEVEEERDDPEEQDRADDPVDDREQPHPEQVDGPRERRHERVLDRPLPALPGDGLGEDLEDHPEVGPDDGADQQSRRRAVRRRSGRRPPRRPRR